MVRSFEGVSGQKREADLKDPPLLKTRIPGRFEPLPVLNHSPYFQPEKSFFKTGGFGWLLPPCAEAFAPGWKT